MILLKMNCQDEWNFILFEDGQNDKKWWTKKLLEKWKNNKNEQNGWRNQKIGYGEQ